MIDQLAYGNTIVSLVDARYHLSCRQKFLQFLIERIVRNGFPFVGDLCTIVSRSRMF